MEMLYFGIDVGTQSVKGVVVDERGCVEQEMMESVGVYSGRGGLVEASVQEWKQAIIRVVQQVKHPHRIARISGSAQQHGSVYYVQGEEQPREKAPIWMDSSTEKECQHLTRELPDLHEITGSAAQRRFTAAQIRKRRELPLRRVHLVSSWAASVFTGDEATPIDWGDASGMNLLDVRLMEWSERCCRATGVQRLQDILPLPVPSHQVVGHAAAWTGFPADCEVVAFTGDNLSSFAGLRVGEGGIAVSLGTSDTVFGQVDEVRPSAEAGHVFVSPFATREKKCYVALSCFSNGSLTREAVRDEAANGSWDDFEAALRGAPDGRLMMRYEVAEITPPRAPGCWRWSPEDEPVHERFPPDAEVRALVEGQMLALRHHSEKLGLVATSHVVATGGASRSPGILQVMADVFAVPVYTTQHANSAALGAAYRAMPAMPPVQLLLQAEPRPQHRAYYDEMLRRYAQKTRQLDN